MRQLNPQERVARNRRKFFMKFGFDIIEYTNMTVTGNTDEEIIYMMGISPSQLEHFRKDSRIKKYRKQVTM